MGERFPTQLHVCVCVCVCFYITVQEMRFLKKGKGPQPTRYQSTCIERHRCKMEAGCQCFYPAPTYQDICRPKYGSAFSQSSLYISVTAGLMRIQIGMRKCRTGLDWRPCLFYSGKESVYTHSTAFSIHLLRFRPHWIRFLLIYSTRHFHYLKTVHSKLCSSANFHKTEITGDGIINLLEGISRQLSPQAVSLTLLVIC